MTPYEVYSDYLSLRNHFNVFNYSYHRYNGNIKTSVTPDSFEKRKDKFFFEKLSQHRDPHGFMLANFAKKPKTWIRDIVSSKEAEETYNNWLKVNQSLSYTFKKDLSAMDEDFNSNIAIKGSHPKLLKLFMSDKITLETLVIICDLTNCCPYWTKRLDDPVYDEIRLLIMKYTGFVDYDKEKYKKILLDFFSKS